MDTFLPVDRSLKLRRGSDRWYGRANFPAALSATCATIVVFGGERTNIGTISQTDYEYTGQRDLEMGLMDHKFRFYSPLLSRFIQPDTIKPGGPQGLNRYSYVNNNPVGFNDPSGHCVKASYSSNVVSDAECEIGTIDDQLKEFGIKTRNLKKKEKQATLTAAQLAGSVLGQMLYGDQYSPEEAFKLLHGSITLQGDESRSNCETNDSTISCGTQAQYMTAFLHEFGHVFDNHAGGRPSDMLGSAPDLVKGY